MAVAKEGGGDDSKRELDELAERHRETVSKATRAVERMERDNRALLELLEAYHRADDVIEKARERL